VRYNSELAVLMIDIDHFKEVNDTHGHRAGDLVLQQLGQTCTGVLREVDVLGRVGGEEFAVLLPETGLVAAAEVAGRLRAAVEEARVARPEGAPLRITVSVGVAGLQGEESLDTLVSRADTALYQAKHGGRNCVRVLAETGPAWTG
jgi:diguanylate cyclase (GGDEF)-like protein